MSNRKGFLLKLLSVPLAIIGFKVRAKPSEAAFQICWQRFDVRRPRDGAPIVALNANEKSCPYWSGSYVDPEQRWQDSEKLSRAWGCVMVTPKPDSFEPYIETRQGKVDAEKMTHWIELTPPA